MEYLAIFSCGVIAGTMITCCFAANKITNRDRIIATQKEKIKELEEKQNKYVWHPLVHITKNKEVPYNKPKKPIDPIILDDDIKIDELMDQINEGR